MSTTRPTTASPTFTRSLSSTNSKTQMTINGAWYRRSPRRPRAQRIYDFGKGVRADRLDILRRGVKLLEADLTSDNFRRRSGHPGRHHRLMPIVLPISGMPV